MADSPVRIAVTGAAGQIGYALLFRLASGELLGTRQSIVLQLLETPEAVGRLRGVIYELNDLAAPLLAGVSASDDPYVAFEGAEIALLVGARPRTLELERSNLLAVNGEVFARQGRALEAVASAEVRVVVVGNPANTNALVAMANAPKLPRQHFSAMTRLDHNRTLSLLAAKAACSVTEVSRVAVWGNHSPTLFPDVRHARIGPDSATEVINDEHWIEEVFIPTVQLRGNAILEARGAPSVGSAATAIIDQAREWLGASPLEDWVSMGIASDGSYGVPEGLVYSFPVTTKSGEYHIVEHLELDERSAARIAASATELSSERDCARELGLLD